MGKFSGFFGGCTAALVLALILIARARNLLDKPGATQYMETMFPLYRCGVSSLYTIKIHYPLPSQKKNLTPLICWAVVYIRPSVVGPSHLVQGKVFIKISVWINRHLDFTDILDISRIYRIYRRYIGIYKLFKI